MTRRKGVFSSNQSRGLLEESLAGAIFLFVAIVPLFLSIFLVLNHISIDNFAIRWKKEKTQTKFMFYYVRRTWINSVSRFVYLFYVHFVQFSTTRLTNSIRLRYTKMYLVEYKSSIIHYYSTSTCKSSTLCPFCGHINLFGYHNNQNGPLEDGEKYRIHLYEGGN